MPQRFSIALVSLITSLTGCAKHQSLAPPVNSEQVIFRLKDSRN